MTFTSLPLSPPLSVDLMLCSCPISLCTIIYIFYLPYTSKRFGFLLPSLTVFFSLTASLSGLWGLAQTQGWLLYKRVSGRRCAARESGEDAESQATGKNGLIRAVQHLRPQSNATVLLHSSLCYITISLTPLLFLSTVFFTNFVLSFPALYPFPPINCTETVVKQQT